MKTSYSLPSERVEFECEATFWMASEIQQIAVQPIQIFVRLIHFNRINCGNYTFVKNEIILSLLLRLAQI